MKKFVFGILFSLLALFVFVSPTYAKVITKEQGSVVISADEVINDDLFIGAETVEVLGTINGDVYIGAGMVTVDGVINGDLFVGGGKVSISGIIRDDVYVGGGDVLITDAQIGDSLLVGSGTLIVDKDSSVGGSLLAGSGTVTNKANVGRNFYVGSGAIDMNSKIDGEVRVGAGKVNVGSNTVVGGDFYYMLDGEQTDLDLPEGAVVLGSLNKLESKSKSFADMNEAKMNFSRSSKAFGRGLWVVSLLGAMLVGFVAIKLCPKKDDMFKTKLLFNYLGIGFLVLVLTVPLAFIVMFTGIGASLAMITLALFGVAVYMAKIVTSLALGSWVSGQFGWRKMNTYANMAFGLVLFFLLKSLPIAGGFISLLFTSVGLGVFFKSMKKH